MSALKKISPFEAKDLAISWIALAVAFTVGAIGLPALIMNGFQGISATTILVYFLIALLTVGVSFVLHELGHKFTAMRFGFWSEFRKNNSMLVLSVAIAAIIGIVFAAPGATLINTSGREMTKKQNGVISLMGPLVNVGLFVVFWILMMLGVYLGGGYDLITGIMTPAGFLTDVGLFGCTINSAIIFFNMLPVGPLDGKKILNWNVVVFFVMIALALGLLLLTYVGSPLAIIMQFFGQI